MVNDHLLDDPDARIWQASRAEAPEQVVYEAQSGALAEGNAPLSGRTVTDLRADVAALKD